MSGAGRDWFVKLLLEVVLIGIAVFLGMAADQWRSDRQERAASREALQRIKIEIQKNQHEVQRVRDYHVRLRDAIVGYLDPKTRAATTLRITEGVNPAKFDRTAWDLALATQALAHIDRDIALALTGIYGEQQTYEELSRGLTQAMYLRPPGESLEPFLQSLKVYYDDIVIHEPALITRYQAVLPMIDSALRD